MVHAMQNDILSLVNQSCCPVSLFLLCAMFCYWQGVLQQVRVLAKREQQINFGNDNDQ